MLAAFSSFVTELKTKWPVRYRQGDFDTLMDRFAQLSIAIAPLAVELRDDCIEIAQSSDKTDAKLKSIEWTIEDWRREMLAPENAA